MPTYLDEILRRHREEAGGKERERANLRDGAEVAEAPRGFSDAISHAFRAEGIALIAEVKRRSPSKGSLGELLDPALLARDYERGGAACLSVLTDGPAFGGSRHDLEQAREAVHLPVLRKDFTVSDLDLYEARAMGADAALLIVAALDDHELRDLHETGRELGLDLLVEVHDEGELDRALAVGSTLIGVNQRDLRTFSVDTDRARRVGKEIPDGVVRVAESGISSRSHVLELLEAGFHAILVGEALVISDDRVAAVRALRSGEASAGG